MSNLSGILETDVEVPSSAEKFYNIWRNESRNIPTITSTNVKGVGLHEGEWDTHGATRIWNYTLDGETTATFKETVEFDDANLSFTFHGLEGEVFDEYKVYKPICKVVPKENGGAVVKAMIQYEKYKEEDPNPDKYLDFFTRLIIDTAAHAHAQTQTEKQDSDESSLKIKTSSLAGILETDVEVDSSAEKFYNIWRNESRNIPTITSTNVKAVALHEGEWDTHGATRIWNYSLDGETTATFKETVEFDDANLSFTFHGAEGEVFDEYKVYKPICKVVPKENGGAVVKAMIQYEKYKEEDPNPDKYLEFFTRLIIDTAAHAHANT